MSVHVPCWWVFGVLCCLCFSWFFILECCLTSPTWCGKRYFLMVSRVLFLRVFSWEHSVPRFCVYWHLAQAYLLLLLRFARKLGAVCNHALSAGNVTHHEVLQRVLVLYYDLESFACPQESYDLWCLRHFSWGTHVWWLWMDRAEHRHAPHAMQHAHSFETCFTHGALFHELAPFLVPLTSFMLTWSLSLGVRLIREGCGSTCSNVTSEVAGTLWREESWNDRS